MKNYIVFIVWLFVLIAFIVLSCTQTKTTSKPIQMNENEQEQAEEMISIPKKTIDRWEATLTRMEQELYNDMK